MAISKKSWPLASRVLTPNFQQPNFQQPNFQQPNFQQPNFQQPNFQQPNISLLKDDQRGSATSEFVLLALPLFVPALLFFLAISQVSRAEMEASFLAREALKAFVTGQNDIEGHQRTRLLLDNYAKLGSSPIGPSVGKELENSTGNQSRVSGTSSIQYSVRCSSVPCIIPGSEIEMTLYSPVDIATEISAIELSAGNVWRVRDLDIKKQRFAIASARGYVDKWN